MLESESPIRCWYHTGFGIAQSISFRAHVYHTEPAKATTFHTTDSFLCWRTVHCYCSNHHRFFGIHTLVSLGKSSSHSVG